MTAVVTVVAHAGADDVASVLFVGGLVAGGLAVRAVVRHRRWTVAALLAIAMLAGAVGVTRWARPSVTQTRVRPRSTAALFIVSPLDGATVRGPDVAVTLRLDGGHLVAAVSTKLAPDQGHIHLAADGRVVSSTASLHAKIRGLSAGRHVITAEYVALDHGPFSPPVRVSVVIVVSS